MTVYVLEDIWVDTDGGDSDSYVGVYANLEDAMKLMKRLMEQARKIFEDCDFEETDFTEGDMSWEIWEKNWYDSRNEKLIIWEKEVL